MWPEQLHRYAGRRGRRGAPTRQQTLGWSVGWSYDLCTPAEQQLWGRLSVFTGRTSNSKPEDNCGGNMSPEAWTILTALVDKSILIAESTGPVRFRLLETLRKNTAARRSRPPASIPNCAVGTWAGTND